MKKFLALFLFSSSIAGFSGGFQLNLQSVRATGFGGAYSGFAFGPAACLYNPAGLTTIKGHAFMYGINLIMPAVSLQTDANDNIDMTSPMGTPMHFYYGGEILKDKLYVGLAVNNLFGSSSSFAEDWQGRFIVQNINLRTFSFQPTLAYKIHDFFSLGAGFVLTTGNFNYEKAVPLYSDPADYGKAVLSGNGLAYSFNLGVYSKPVDNDKMRLSIGVNYRHSQSLYLGDGVATFTDIPSSLVTTFPATTAFTSTLTLPNVFTAGFAWTLKKDTTHSIMVAYDFQYTLWSVYDTLSFDFANIDTPDSKTDKLWKDSPTFRFGLEYGFRNMLFIRAGGYYDVSPVLDGYLSPELPDMTQFVPTAGVGILIKEKFGLDISWMHQDKERTAALTSAGWSAKYHRIADIFSFSASFNF